jgi:hypothetical protein
MPAKQFEVKAKEHSATGGSALNTGVTVVKGERLIIKAAEDDTWACGAAADLTSNANGLVVGNKYGGVYGNMLSQTSGTLLPYGSLVGSLDGGKSHFLVGTQYDAPVQQAGTLSLCYWDGNSDDNTGSVAVSVDVRPAVVSVMVDPVRNNAGIGVPCQTGVVVNKGDELRIGGLSNNKFYTGLKSVPMLVEDANGAQAKLMMHGFEFPLCSLVGSLDGGKTFFFVGKAYIKKNMTESGTLSLFFWTADDNNKGLANAVITLYRAA